MAEPIAAPVVTKDPRFLAGRKLCERGLADEAVEMYATLLEETTQKYGPNSIETGPAYYEYGNSLLRATTKKIAVSKEVEERETRKIKDSNKTPQQRSVAAAAAERRQQCHVDKCVEEDKKPAAVTKTNDGDNSQQTEEKEEEISSSDRAGDDSDDRDDLKLGLEMMENAFSILEEYEESNEKEEEDNTRKDDDEKKYYDWVKEQIPRVLLGIGDTLSTLSQHADAADTYSRALELRKVHLQKIVANSEGIDQRTLEHLQAHRRVCEANILIAEELLSCPQNLDVITTETQSLIVKTNERVSYARGYYDQARDALQEAVFYMGSLKCNEDLGREKEDVCFLATLLMGVGESLATLDEETNEAAAVAATTKSIEPVTKKAKRK
mmetsp:Transcript_36311/g.40526  ORF Transcript_36311/g.40526 Transcript_36311/m.40526 type:complete len:382 (-) Transcript_36311:221-1366(-)